MMVKNANRKVHTSSGMSIVIALMACLLAAMVSSVLISAAQTNVERAARTRKQNQDYLIAESTVTMTKDAISNLRIYFSCTEETTLTRITGKDGALSPSSRDWGEISIEKIETKGKEVEETELNPIAGYIYGGIETCWSSGTFSTPSEFSIIVSEKDSGNEVNRTRMKITPAFDTRGFSAEHDAGQLSFDFSITSYLENTDYKNAMTISAKGKCIETLPDITEGIFISDGTDKKTESKTVTTTHHYEISWENFLITKGISTPTGGTE